MEYLVTMTTRVPVGTPEEAVADVRAREAAHSRDLAARGHLLRLWRPPLAPGEWRSLGLFAAADGDELERVLASMPLRVWRTDEVTPLGPHGNDPGPGSQYSQAQYSQAQVHHQPGPEFLTDFTVLFPDGTPGEVIEEATGAEGKRARELAAQGYLLRLWTLPSATTAWRALGLWRVEDAARMQQILDALPLDPWMTTVTTPLTPHPSDPAATGAAEEGRMAP